MIPVKIYENDEVNGEELNNYFILPFYKKESIIYIVLEKENASWYNGNLKSISCLKRMNKSLLNIYRASKFNNSKIVIIGFLDKIQNYRTLTLFDLLSYDEFIGNTQSKKYSIRLENLKSRFFTESSNKIKTINSIFSYKHDEQMFINLFCQCILTNRWEGYMLHKDCSYNFFNDDKLEFIERPVWETFEGKIVDVSFGDVVIKEKDKDDKEIEKHEQGIKSLYVMYEDKKLEVMNGITINERIQFFKNVNDILGKTMIYKYFRLNDQDRTIFFKIKN